MSLGYRPKPVRLRGQAAIAVQMFQEDLPFKVQEIAELWKGKIIHSDTLFIPGGNYSCRLISHTKAQVKIDLYITS